MCRGLRIWSDRFTEASYYVRIASLCQFLPFVIVCCQGNNNYCISDLLAFLSVTQKIEQLLISVISHLPIMVIDAL